MTERIIDAHAHIFPAKIAEKAVENIGRFYDLEMHDRGTGDALIESGSRIGTERYLVCSTATRPAQVQSINDFIWEESQKHPEFVPFATFHPYMEDVGAEFDRIMRRRYYGIKLHPDFQEFNIDDGRAFEIYRRAEEAGLFILFHTGDARYDYSRPSRLARVCDRFPDLKCIAAHFGGYQSWEEAYTVYDSKNIFMDTSSSLFTLPRETALRFIDKFGAEQFFWGTDFPMWKHEAELARFDALGLPERERGLILAGNFAREVLGER